MTYRELKAYASVDKESRRMIDEYIDGIADPQTREMFHLRFRKGLKYFQVAMRLGGGMTAGCVRMRISRHMEGRG